MRIDDTNQAGLNKLNDTSAKKKTSGVSQSSTDSTAGSASSSDSITISDTAKDMASISSGVKNSPDVRADVVASLKDKIANGQYNVTGRQVADKIVQSSIDEIF